MSYRGIIWRLICGGMKMGDSLSKIVAIVLAVLLMFIIPIKSEFERLDDISRIYVLNETTKFVDRVRNLGYITPRMYLEYVRNIEATDNLYEVRLEHGRKIYIPVYEESLSGNLEFKEEHIEEYDTSFTEDIIKVLLPDSPVGGDDIILELRKGDYFAVTVFNTNRTMATKMQEMLGSNVPVEKIFVRYGGLVND